MIRLVRTCFGYPEQYDAYLDGKQVGYLRLRNSDFTVEFPKCDGETIYQATPKGDGMFENGERDHYLRTAVTAILKKLDGEVIQASLTINVDYEIVSSTQ